MSIQKRISSKQGLLIPKGKNTFKWTMLLTGLIAVAGIVYGAYSLHAGYIYTKMTNGTILNITVSKSGYRRRSETFLEVKYNVDNVEYQKMLESPKNTHSTGENISVYYDPNNPANSTLSSESASKWVAIVAIVVGVIFAIITIALYRAKSTDTFWEIAFWSSIFS